MIERCVMWEMGLLEAWAWAWAWGSMIRRDAWEWGSLFF